MEFAEKQLKQVSIHNAKHDLYISQLKDKDSVAPVPTTTSTESSITT